MRNIQNFIDNSFTESKNQVELSLPISARTVARLEFADLPMILLAIQGAKRAFHAALTQQDRMRDSVINLLALASAPAESAILEALQEQELLENQDFDELIWNSKAHFFKSLMAQATEPRPNNFPTGLIVIELPSRLSLRYATEFIFVALASGNAVIAVCNRENAFTGEYLASLASGANFPSGLLQILYTEKTEDKELLFGHPSVAAVISCSSLKVSQEKKFHFVGPANNSALILEPLDQDSLRLLLRASFLASGLWPFSIKKIFTLESFHKDFKEMLLAELQKVMKPLALLNEAQFNKAQSVLEQAKVEAGKLIFGGEVFHKSQSFWMNPTVIEDLPNCSELQQQSLAAPVVLLSSVKYSHEMAKWVNNSPYGMAAMVLGEPEKATRLATKLEVGQVWVNRWIEAEKALPTGLKQSGLGISDKRINGNFFSNFRKLSVP